MKKAIYCYWGAVGDHNLNIPGHPLYQLYFLRVLKKKFRLDKIYFYSFLKNAPEKSVADCKFFINEEQRKAILRDLNIKIVTLTEALTLLPRCDYVFLKARFRNPSRLLEKSYDALKFEEFLRRSSFEKTWIIDSDGELPQSFFQEPRNIITYFCDAKKFYQSQDIKYLPEVITLPCALHDDFCTEVRPLSEFKYDLFFIGNQGLKQKKLPQYLEQLTRDGLRVGVNGKWKDSFSFKIYPRKERDKAYRAFKNSLSTIQISKEKYRKYSFLSPRIYEAAVVGIMPFIEKGYLCATDFAAIENYVELREKTKCLYEGFERDFQTVRDEEYQRLYEIESILVHGL